MKCVVVYKVPRIDRLRDERPEREAELRRESGGLVRGLEIAADRHRASLDTVHSVLTRRGVEFESWSQDEFSGRDGSADLVITVGGDGTVLDASHTIRESPLLAVNSNPGRSVGYFCACDADEFAQHLEEFATGRAGMTVLHRLEIRLNDSLIEIPCLNDLLVANSNPAVMSRYEITAGERSETQASSGVWISTPAGSTGALRSAGGPVMPLGGAMLQYLVREPHMPREVSYRLLRGVRHMREGLELQSLMDDGRIYIDGPHKDLRFNIGDRMSLSAGPTLSMVNLIPSLRGR